MRYKHLTHLDLTFVQSELSINIEKQYRRDITCSKGKVREKQNDTPNVTSIKG